MNIYQFSIVGRRRPVFHAEHPEDTTPRDERGRPIRSRLERWWRKLRAILARSVRRGGPSVGRLWNWLNRRPPPDEPLLEGLRHAERITLFHSSRIADFEAHRAWRHYLARRWRSHLVTLAWDLAIGPFIALLMVLPGPNILGYWFVYRIVSHLLAMRGVLRARLGWIPLEFQAHAALDQPIDLHNSRDAEQAARELGLDDLQDFLNRLAVYYRRKVEASVGSRDRQGARVHAGSNTSVEGASAEVIGRGSDSEDEPGSEDAGDSVF